MTPRMLHLSLSESEIASHAFIWEVAANGVIKRSSDRSERKGAVPEGGVARVALFRDALERAPICGHKVCKLVRNFGHLWI